MKRSRLIAVLVWKLCQSLPPVSVHAGGTAPQQVACDAWRRHQCDNGTDKTHDTHTHLHTSGIRPVKTKKHRLCSRILFKRSCFPLGSFPLSMWAELRQLMTFRHAENICRHHFIVNSVCLRLSRGLVRWLCCPPVGLVALIVACWLLILQVRVILGRIQPIQCDGAAHLWCRRSLRWTTGLKRENPPFVGAVCWSLTSSCLLTSWGWFFGKCNLYPTGCSLVWDIWVWCAWLAFPSAVRHTLAGPHIWSCTITSILGFLLRRYGSGLYGALMANFTQRCFKVLRSSLSVRICSVVPASWSFL